MQLAPAIAFLSVLKKIKIEKGLLTGKKVGGMGNNGTEHYNELIKSLTNLRKVLHGRSASR